MHTWAEPACHLRTPSAPQYLTPLCGCLVRPGVLGIRSCRQLRKREVHGIMTSPVEVGITPDSGDDVPSARVDFINTAPNIFCRTSLPKWGRRRRNDPRRSRPPCVCGITGRPSAVVHRDMMRVAQAPRISVLRSRLRRTRRRIAVVGLEICAGKLELVQFQPS